MDGTQVVAAPQRNVASAAVRSSTATQYDTTGCAMTDESNASEHAGVVDAVHSSGGGSAERASPASVADGDVVAVFVDAVRRVNGISQSVILVSR